MKNIVLILILFASLCLPGMASAQTVILKTDTVTVNCAATDTFLVPVRVQNFTNVGSFQFTLSWNPANLDYAYTTAMNPAFLGLGVNVGFDSVSFINQNPSKITFTWTKFNGGSVPDGTQVFALAFRRIGGPFSAVQFTSNPVAIEVTDKDGNELLFQTVSGGVKPLDDKNPVITCPADVMTASSFPPPVNNIAPASVTDNCSINTVGWTSSGATVANMPNDPDASGAVFNFGVSTVIYKATDVGGNTATCSFLITVDPINTSDTLTLIATGASGSCGQTLSINITALNFDSLGSLQFSLGWNSTALQYASVSNFNPALNLSGNNFGIALVNSGNLSFNWTTNMLSGTTIPQGAVLFTLNFNVVGGSGSSSPINFVDIPSIREAYTSAVFPPEETPAIWVNGAANIQDLTPPVLSCPQNVLVDAPIGTTSVQVSNLQPLSLSDNCSGTVGLAYTQAGVTSGQGSGNANGSYYAGTTTVTYTATDAAGNTSTCSFLVVVNAGTPVTLLLDSVTVDCQGAGSQISVNVRVKDFNDIVGLQFGVNWDKTVLQFVSVTNEYPGLGLTPANYNGFANVGNGQLQFLGGNAVTGWPQIADNGIFFTINFTVLNPNATSQISFMGPFEADNSALDLVPVNPVNGYFLSVDQSPPTIVCAADISVDATGSCQVDVPVPYPQTSDACSGVESVVIDQPDNTFDAGATVVTFTATDLAGNTATCSLTVTVHANTAPQISNCPANIIQDAPGTACEATITWTPPTAKDACGASINAVGDHTPGTLFPVGSSTVLYKAMDSAGDSVTCSFKVFVRDTVSPTLVCPPDMTLTVANNQCCAPGNFPIPMISDNCDTHPDTLSDHTPNENYCVGSLTINYFGVDDFGNIGGCSFKLTVVDNAPPTISGCPADIVKSSDPNVCGAIVDWTEPTGDDLCDPNPLTINKTDDPGSFFPVGTKTVQYSFTDFSGNSDTCSFNVTVTETQPPVITNCPGQIFIELPANKCDSLVNWLLPVATDNCGTPTLTSNVGPGTVFVVGTKTVTYTATDAAGNTATCSFDVILKDLVPPTFSNCPHDTTLMNVSPCNAIPVWTFPSAMDNCSNPPVIDSSSYRPGQVFPVGITNVVILATDASGNSDTCSFTVTVIGTPPGFTGVPANITLDCPQAVTWIEPLPVGICALDTTFSNHHPGDEFPLGVTLVTYTAVDTSGVSTTATFSVTITDVVAPFMTCPTGPIVVNVAGVIGSDPSEFIATADTVANCDGVKLSFLFPSASDNCTTVQVNQTAGITSGMVFPVGKDTLTFVATDGGGNTVACSVTIEVDGLPHLRPSADPSPACPGQLFVTLSADSIGGAVYTWVGPQTSYPSTPKINVVNDQSNTGLYQVFALINGCKTPVDTVYVVLASDPDAVDDVNFVIDPGMTDTFSTVLANDVLVPASDFSITMTSQLSGLTMNPDGTFILQAGNNPGNISFFYEVCSKSCPDLCDMAVVTIKVKDEKCSFIPNIFTPNGDNSNDYFKIPCIDTGSFDKENSLVVYNQWGDKVYEAKPYSNDPSKAWKGTLNGETGKDLPDGVYFYIFKPSPNEPTIKGFVEIFR